MPQYCNSGMALFIHVTIFLLFICLYQAEKIPWITLIFNIFMQKHGDRNLLTEIRGDL